LTLTANSVQVVAESCTSGLPGSKTEAIGGKVGEDQIAVPMTTTQSSAETTPGFQTEAATAQLVGKNPQAVQSGMRPSVPYAPFKPEQVAQSEAAANVNADAALRAEILPGNTLGVSGSTPSSSGTSTRTNRKMSPGPTNSARTVVDITGDQAAELSHHRVTIKLGETVEWRNSGTRPHEIVANPAKAKPASKPVLPAGATPFDSGFVRPGHSFTQRFTVPGLYRYICDLDSPKPVEGEVVVAP
jgi:plastocyanin